MQTPTLETPRLLLRAYRPDDFDAYAAMWADPGVVRFLGGAPYSREQAWTRFLRQIGLWAHLGFGFFVIEDRRSGAFVGECGFHDLRRAVVPSLEGTMEVGWVLVEGMRGRGVAEEAMRAAIGWAAAHGTGDRLTCMIEPDNAPSLRLAEKLGFVSFANTAYNGTAEVLLQRPRRAAAPHLRPE